MNFERIEVECYSGYKANERPIAFTFRYRRRQIEEIIDRWYEGGVQPGRPEVNYFKVRTDEGEVFLIRYLALFDAWSIRVPETGVADVRDPGPPKPISPRRPSSGSGS